jgi:hypothetical protein
MPILLAGPARASPSWTPARHKVEQSACKPIVESVAAELGREVTAAAAP